MRINKSKKWLLVENRILTVAKDLLNQNNVAISVSSVCDRANISRSSFYKHYSNIDALLLKIRDEQISRIKKVYLRNKPKNGNEIYVNLLKYVKKNKNMFINVFSMYSFEFYNDDNLRIIDSYMYPMYSEECKNEDDRLVHIMYYHTYYHAALINCVLLWLNRGCKETEEELSKILYDCSKSELYSIFDKKYLKQNDTQPPNQ